MDDLKELLAKKRAEQKEPMSEGKKNAKMSVLNELKSLMDNSIAGDLKGMKKVTVASDSKEGLKEGLEKAEDVLESSEMDEEEPEQDDLEGASPEEIQEMISMLQEKLSRKK